MSWRQAATAGLDGTSMLRCADAYSSNGPASPRSGFIDGFEELGMSK